MIISFDSRTFLNSRVRKIHKKNLSKSLLINNYTFLSKSTSGPKKFISDLILTIEENDLCKTTLNFIKSDIHLLNAGFYSPIWAHFQPKKKNRVIIRLDGVGLDSEDIDPNKIKNRFYDLLYKGSYVIYQSEFSKNIEWCKNSYEASENSDALVILTEWNQFRALDLKMLKIKLKKPVIIDLRNIYNPTELKNMGFEYYSLGRSFE